MPLLQRLMLLSGLLLTGLAGGSLVSFQAFQARALAGTIPLRSPSAPASPVLGRLDIPRLNLSVAVLDDADPNSLSLGAGHIVGTSPIGSLGNAAIAGHRDTSFRALRSIRKGDRIVAQTNHTYTYVVDSIKIVDPSDTSLLFLNSSPTLTLVTCYPFDYVGSAPRRFVVQAKLVF